ncbi:hypothetical protein M947_08650 [Sulfurimonas hongkongensis]|uniref:DUF4476 domain-containing protein n=1 Tax=Sulfurimonas hongkongensis TaxID=1172190 RepID=T0KYY5_9BACT|nr:hypothetical protein [Sulfurimonas hongkongensis]EQB38758.1 hypothetical protein M947_08650 [Sulfurimonas hongkongensis]
MKKNKNILSLVFLASSLTLSPLLASSTNQQARTQSNSLSNNIANNLYSRGIDRDVSKKIAKRIFGEDEGTTNIMLINLQNNYTSLSQQEIVNFLSTEALLSKSVDLSSYDYLVSMVYKIKNKPLSSKDLKELSYIAKKNYFYSQSL